MPDLRDQLQNTLGTAYTLEREIGGGGMSRIFLAEDTSLGRKIVVKMLPSDTAAAVSVERFKREIRVVAHLQHPHIVPVLSAGQVGELPFYTMPFVKGESLRARLQRSGELSVNEAVHVLRDVAAALAYAHGEGVVHRDIKPDNVIVSGGVAVVTDFGVSKAVDVAATDSLKAQSGITSLGVALGTPAYMAPEQASADPHLDHRADIYSFGCLAYELLAGTSPFAGRTPQQMLSAHVTEAPESLTRRRPNVPPTLSALIMRCLEKRAGDRPQSADELLNTLDAIATTPSGGTVPTAERLRSTAKPSRWKFEAGVGLVLLLLVAALAWREAIAFHPAVVAATRPIAIGPNLEREPAISPDGKLVAYVSETESGARIFVRQVDGGDARPISGDVPGDHDFPKWLPDGTRVSFVADGSIYTVPALTGGAAKRIVDGAGTHTWSLNGKTLVYATDDLRSIRAQSLDGGPARTIAVGAVLHSPAISPDGNTVLYNEGALPTLGNVSVSAIWAVPLAGGSPIRISDSLHVNLSPIWMPDGRSVLFISDIGGSRDVYQIPVSSDGHPRGAPKRLTTGVSSYWISLSADASRLVYDVVRNNSNIYVAPLQDGAVHLESARPVTRDNEHIEAIALSHDGKWIAYDTDRGGNFDIYKQKLDGGEPIQLTTNSANEFAPSWSPDDKQIAYHSTRNGTRDLYVIDADGRDEQQVTSGASQDLHPRWSPDGQHLVYRTFNGAFVNDSIRVLSKDANGHWSVPVSIAYGPNLFCTVWSPDGKWIAAAIDGNAVVYSPDGRSHRVLLDGQQLGRPAIHVEWSTNSAMLYVTTGRPINTPFNASNQRQPLASSGVEIFAVPLNGEPRRLVAADSRDIRFAALRFAIDDTRLFFVRAAWETNVWMAELKH